MKINEDLLPKIEYETNMPAPIIGMISVDGNPTISKTMRYGGVQIPWNVLSSSASARTETNLSSYFELRDGLIYYKGTKRAVIHFDVEVEVYGNDTLYLLYGDINGYYRTTSSFVKNTLGGNHSNGSASVIVKNGDYLSFQVGAPEAFSNLTVGTSRCWIQVLGFLNN